MSGSVQWTEITSLVYYTICGPQIKLVLDGPCWKFPKIPTDGWLSQHQLGFLSGLVTERGQNKAQIWNPRPQFAYSLYNFYGATKAYDDSLWHFTLEKLHC